jgi:hypothetical protein
MSLRSYQISLSTPLTEETEINVQLQPSNNLFYGSFRSVVSKVFGPNENTSGKAASLASQSLCETVGSVSTQRSHSSATGQSTLTASLDMNLAGGESSVALQSCYSDQGLAILSSNNLPHETRAVRLPSVEKQAKVYTYILVDLGSAIGKQEAAEDAGANLSLALQTFSENAFVGTPAYASPEAFVQQVCL